MSEYKKTQPKKIRHTPINHWALCICIRLRRSVAILSTERSGEARQAATQVVDAKADAFRNDIAVGVDVMGRNRVYRLYGRAVRYVGYRNIERTSE